MPRRRRTPIAARHEVRPTSGTPQAATVGLEVVDLLRTGEYQERARRIGARLTERLGALIGHGLFSARVHGAWAGVDVDPELMTAR